MTANEPSAAPAYNACRLVSPDLIMLVSSPPARLRSPPSRLMREG